MNLSKYNVKSNASCLVIPRDAAIKIIVDYCVDLVSDKSFVEDCLINGAPLPIEAVSNGVPLNERPLGNIAQVMRDIGIVDQLDEHDIIILAESTNIKDTLVAKTAFIL